jgi:hypothetical protein
VLLVTHRPAGPFERCGRLRLGSGGRGLVLVPGGLERSGSG